MSSGAITRSLRCPIIASRARFNAEDRNSPCTTNRSVPNVPIHEPVDLRFLEVRNGIEKTGSVLRGDVEASSFYRVKQKCNRLRLHLSRYPRQK
jgi:hypothetical protein